LKIPAEKTPSQRQPPATLQFIGFVQCSCGADSMKKGTEAQRADWTQCNYCGGWEHTLCAAKNPKAPHVKNLPYYACHVCCEDDDVVKAVLLDNAKPAE
jgi:hypothetical protein